MKPTILGIFIILLTFLSCSKKETEDTPEEESDIISNLDYSQMENWAFHPDNNATIINGYNLDIAVIDENLEVESIIPIENNSFKNTGVDVFFVHPTVLAQITDPAQAIDIEEQQGLLISLTIIAQGGLLSKYGRLFAPRYRQSTGQTYSSTISKELQASVLETSYSDIKAAFLEYLDNYNNGNKIILAGHSQGSYLLAMLLRDLFDENQSLRNKLVTAALGGMGYIYSDKDTYSDGWWKNISLCKTEEECGCVNNWASFEETQTLPDINTGLPAFNEILVDKGLVYRTIDETNDWFIQDSSYYGDEPTPLRYYIAPDAAYDFADEANFIAFDNLYTARFRRDGLLNTALSIEYSPLANDNRPNDLAEAQNHPNYNNWGYHTKDYHIYLWALMEQIDMKLQNCF
ncbi:DUF3089 domain-containing protein [Flavivirga aquimarina]|uniref:DUF3089 domain-containing protein n=1 Tax=Flavivirga aquimarina TaxID=2027862 RepID=A0ABT8WGC4_9FLAO|nr:DUF3089 domain-containing protein [Flavivirga aquimarina]MDO5972041.1 DUF3089 domain-containing protein [Flavivirga aquimarina]